MRWRIVPIGLAVLGLLIVIGVLAVHLPPVRSLTLRYAMRAALAQGLRIDAESLHYNLAARHVRLVGVTVSAVGDDLPFFTADEVAATFSYRVFVGDVALGEVVASNGAVTIVSRADGTTNLPRTSGGERQGDPTPLPIERLYAPSLAVEYRDEAGGIAVRVPAITVDLSSQGRLALDKPAELAIDSTSTSIDTLEGPAAFDGRDLRVTALRVEMPELRATVEGTLALIRRQPAIDVRVSGDARLENAAKWWGETGDTVRGVVHLDGSVSGPLGQPSASLTVGSDAVSWQGIDIAGVTAQLELDTESVDARDARFQFAGGQVTGAGRLDWRAGSARVEAAWRNVDAARLVAAFGDPPLGPSGLVSGEGTGSGSIESLELWNVDAQVTLEGGQRGRRQLPAPGTARFRLASGDWSLEASHVIGEVVPVDLSLTGQLRSDSVRDSTIMGTARVAESDVQAMVGMLSEAGVVSVRQGVVTGSLRAAAEVQGTIGRPVVALTVEGDEVFVAGQEFVDVQAQGRLAGSTFDLDELTAAQPSPEGQQPAGRVRVVGRYDLAAGGYSGSVNAESWRITETSEVPVSGLVRLEFTGEGRGSRAFGKGRIVSDLFMSPDVPLGEIVADVELAGDEAIIIARAAEFDAVAEATVSLAAPYIAVLRANAPMLDLARAVGGADLPVAVDGAADVRVEAEGPLAQWRQGRASVEVATLNGRVQALPVSLREPARARYENGRVVLEQLSASIGDTFLSASGALPLANESATTGQAAGEALLATLTGDLADIAAAADAARPSTSGAYIAAGRGPVVLLARVTGSLERPAITADLEVGPGMVQPRADLAPIEDLQVRAHVEDGLVELLDLAGTYRGATVRATGQVPLALLTGDASAPADGMGSLRATAVGVTSAVLAPFVDPATLGQVGGSIDARVDLSSPSLRLEDVEGEIVLDRLELTIADLPVRQRTPTRVVAQDGFARIASWDWAGEGTSFTVGGQVRLRDQQAGILANGTFDARLLTPFLDAGTTATGGQVNTRLSITGTLTEPTINGDARLTDGEIRVREPRIIAADLDAVAVLSRSRAYLTSLSGLVNGGVLSGSGEVQYSPEVRGVFKASIDGMAMEFPEGLRSEIDSALELTTTGAEGGQVNRLSGVVTIRRGVYREPLALVTGVLANLQRAGTPSGSPPSPFLQSLALDVRVVTDDDLVLDNNVARARLGADLRVINVAASPGLSGRAELREGGQLFLGRNTYTVESGTIDFSNPTAIEPVLGIEATTTVSGVEIAIRISGDPDNMTTQLSSPTDPELGQADLTSLLLTGRRMEALGEAEAAVVGAQVLGNLAAGDVLGIAGRAVGLDTLRVGSVETNTRDPADLASEVDPTSRLTFGKSFGSQVDVTLSQSLRESGAQTWIVDYQPVRRIALRLVSNDQDLRSYEFRHDLTFGAAPRPIRSAETSREVAPEVSAIRLTGQLLYPEGELRDQLELNEGDRFDFIDWQEDRDRLERFYHQRHHLTARITADRREEDSGVELTYDIEAGPETQVQVSGMSLPRSVIDELETSWTRSVYEGFLIEEAEVIVRRELAQQASYQASVQARVEGDQSVRTLVIDVTPGPRAERVELGLEGLDDALRQDVLDEVGDRAQAVRALTDPREFERTLLSLLQSWGYQRTSVSVGVPVFAESVATIPVMAIPGPQFRLGRVSVEGATGIALDELRAEAALEEGTVYRPADVENARDRLQSRYRREGFTRATIEARQDVREDEAVADVRFTIDEGPRQVIGEIAVSGLDAVDEDVVRRTLRLNVGDNLRTADWLEARRRLFESGLFRRVDISVEPLSDTGETAPVGLRVTVEEWPALRFRYGFQLAEERPEEDVNGRDLVPGVSADLTRRTVFGRAMTVGLAGQYEQRERLGRAFMSTPTVLGRPIQSSLILERSREEFRADTLVTNRTTASWEQRGRRGPLSLSYGLRFERNRTFDTAPTDPDFVFDLTAHIGRLTSSATWDTRDDPSDSTRGTFMSSSIEHATSRLGSDLFFLRSLTQLYHFQTWSGVVFASAVRYGAVKPLKGQQLIPTFRFYAGGSRTVRGVAEDTLGGVDFLGNPVGGQGVLTLNQEMRFPIYRWLRGVAFVDAGNVFAEPGAVSLRELVGAGGIGLRAVTPFMLLRVDYGRTLWNRPFSDSGRWTFGIGQTF